MDSTLTSSPLPSLSPLTGSVRTSVASEAIEKAFIDSTRRWLTTPGGSRHLTVDLGSSPHVAPPKEGTSGLRDAASKHVALMDRAPGTPYQRVLSPAAKAVLKKEMAQKLQLFVEQLQAAATASKPAVPSGAEESQAAVGAAEATAAAAKRPSTSLPTHDLVMQRPSSRLARTPSLKGVSSSWSGPFSSLEKQQQQRPSNFHSSSRLGTPSSPRTHHLRLGTPPGSPLKPSRLTGRAEVWTNNVNVSSSRRAPEGGPNHSESQGPCTTSMRLKAGSSGHFERPKPSRGLLYSVFQDLDKYGDGRVTYSMFEEAALLVGIHTEQAKRFFSAMDKRSQGFITTKEWGSDEFEHQLNDFTRLFIQKTRATDGRYKGASEIDSLYAALQLAIYKLHLKNSGRSVSHERLLQAFHFIDRDMSGMLDSRELLDAFNGMGIYITDEVLEEAMKAFDKDGNGGIEYAEFITTLFPTLSKGYRMG